MNKIYLALCGELINAPRACLGGVDSVHARGEMLHRALPQDAALIVELHDACP